MKKIIDNIIMKFPVIGLVVGLAVGLTSVKTGC